MTEEKNKAEFIEAYQVANLLGISESTLAKMIKSGAFPPPLRLGMRKRVWLLKTFCQVVERASTEGEKAGHA